jgi:hypothetical protein
MKIKIILAGITICAGLAAVSGCKKEQPAADLQAAKTNESVTPAPTQPIQASAPAAAPVTNEAIAQVTNAVMAQATNESAAAVNTADSQTQGLIDRAKSLVADGKYQDAMTNLTQLANTKLTPDQQSLVDDLKSKIQAALAKAATGDVLGGALGGKK